MKRNVTSQVCLLAMLAASWLSTFQYGLAQFDSFGRGGVGARQVTSPLSPEAVIIAAQGDQPAILAVTLNIDDGFKTYSITQPPGGPIQTKIKLDASDKYIIGGFLSVEEPKIHPEPVFDNLLVEEHTGSVTWYAPLSLAEGVTADSLEIKGKVNAQACDATGCLPPKDHPFVAKIGKSPVSLPKVKPIDPAKIDHQKLPANGTSKVDVAQPPPTAIGDAPPGLSNQANAPPAFEPRVDYDVDQLTPQSKGSSSTSLPLMIGAAVLAGFILNFMPCVLPVIGLKLLSFLEQGGRNPRRVLMLNFWYSLGIVSVFWVLAGITIVLRLWFGQSFGWGQQFSYDGFNIALISIVFVMALSFLGVWEIPIPGFAGSRNAQEMAAKEGALGAFVKGMITTLLATPCSGPFLGTAVGFALISPPIITFLIFTFMGLGMAAPYLLIGMRPQLMKFLPKPGPWMDTFKQVMGFVLLATVLWLMLPVDAHLLMPTLILLTGLAAACWWIGRTPGYAERGEKLKAWGQSAVFAAVVGWLAFAMPQVTDPLPWRKFTMAQFVGDVNANKTVLVEFTAEWCATCKALKAANLDRSKTKATVSSNNVVVYEVDIDRINEQEREFFMKMQPSGGVPLVAIFPAGKKYEPISFGNGYTQSQILAALKDAGPSGTN
jgi:thiol:disulfide interchange protein